MKKTKAVVLFSGGKDSVYSLIKASEEYEIVSILTMVDETGNVQLTDGIELNNKIIRDLAKTYPYPYEEVFVKSEKEYLKDMVSQIKQVLKRLGVSTVITGDLDHEEGMDKVLDKEGIVVVSPAGEFFREHGAQKYIDEISKAGIQLIVSGIRGESLPQEILGKEFNKQVVNIIKEKGLDITGEDGEFQTLVYSAPLMSKKMIINNFSIEQSTGRDSKGYNYLRMENINYSLEEK